MVRLLIRREYNRRTQGTSQVKASDYAREFRIGRPKQKEARPMIEQFILAEAHRELAATSRDV